MQFRRNAALFVRSILILFCLSACGTASMPSTQNDAQHEMDRGGGGGY